MEKGICPVCNGTKQVPLSEKEKGYSWFKGYTHRGCTNCGGQRMFGTPTGEVPLRADGTPCKHEYEAVTVGRCLTRYTCKHCSEQYEIDSSD